MRRGARPDPQFRRQPGEDFVALNFMASLIVDSRNIMPNLAHAGNMMGSYTLVQNRKRRWSLGMNGSTVLYSRASVELAAMDWKPYITTDPQIMHGAVCFRGTRIPVSVVLDNLAVGETSERILDQYPSLKPEHIPAALGYAADLARERIVPIPA
jgi:uncharacterized protein (DUF433 family)